MLYSTIQTTLMPTCFGLLFLLMLFYWSQAAIFSYIRYTRSTFLLLILSILSLTSLLLLRWIESGHFPLSNLYESLLFLSWSFLMTQLVLLISNRENLQSNQLQDRSGTRSLKFVQANTIPPTLAPSVEEGPGSGEYNVTGTQFDLLGVITSPMALLTYSFAFFTLPKEMQKATALVPALQSNWLMMHVSIMILSYAALLCGSIISITFLLLTSFPSSPYLAFNLHSVQSKSEGDTLRVTPPSGGGPGLPNAAQALWHVQRDIENKRITDDQASDISGTRLKSDEMLSANTSYLVLTEKLDNLSYRILGLGFPLLTMGILSGAVWANEAWGSYWSWDPKETWAFITWLVFAIYLHARITKGWSGRKPALIATFGFFVVWFCYLGVNLLGTGLHSYGWFSNSFK